MKFFLENGLEKQIIERKNKISVLAHNMKEKNQKPVFFLKTKYLGHELGIIRLLKGFSLAYFARIKTKTKKN